MAIRDHILTPARPRDVKRELSQGAIGGVIAGLVFAAFEMMASTVMMGWDALFMPLRMIGAIALGPAALEPDYSLLGAGLAGLMIHMVLSIIYGAIFGLIATVLRGAAAIIGLASLFGFALWLFNFYVIAPMAFPWFLQSSPLVQFIGHTFFFGSVLGYYLWKSHESGDLESRPTT